MDHLTFTALTPTGFELPPSTGTVNSRDPLCPAVSSFPFNGLPREIRLLVWEEALLQESSERIVVLSSAQFDISRACALKFFDLKLSLFDKATFFIRYYMELHLEDFAIPQHTPEDEKCVYISLEHDIFTTGLNFQPVDGTKLSKLSMTPTTFAYSPIPFPTTVRLMDAPMCHFHDDGETLFPSKITAKYRTKTIWPIRSRIQNVLAPYADGFCYITECPAACPCQKRRYPEAFVELFWSDRAFPGVQRYFMFPWGPNTEYETNQFLEYLFKRQSGESLPAKYEPRELTWDEQVKTICGDVPHETRRYRVLTDPDIEEFRLCRCSYGNNGDIILFVGNQNIHALMSTMYRMYERVSAHDNFPYS
ncbi:uncharacterized protein F4807DRAFT_455900 [Annulohypoxylon truncatum]|uniref:uncharacterized protein n=1 Tax=Annulohypoxylon truncatum TaxID=327061 RepID=UPI0020082048|nr:uncharacterized protein F4807DRAFT_455900 [Annulohypoxylon truncatum]KAI1214260.1 hypothetical protein F4807DRAFT_455900 [Annulohypoxylon truncatum]